MYRDDAAAAAAMRDALDADLQRELRPLTLTISRPCTERWADMPGDERVRHCGRCDKDVFNLLALRRAEIDALLTSHGADLCMRLHRRADGTIMTADCVDARQLRRRRRVVAASMTAALAASVAVLTLVDPPPQPPIVGSEPADPSEWLPVSRPANLSAVELEAIDEAAAAAPEEWELPEAPVEVWVGG